MSELATPTGRKRLLSLGAVLLLAGIAAWAGYRVSRGGKGSDVKLTVHFVVPDGYRGIFKLVVDRGAGARIEPQGPKANVFRYEIPDHGVLRVRDAEPIGSWQRQAPPREIPPEMAARCRRGG